jgi:heme-degrading monooxygenase HmoA
MVRIVKMTFREEALPEFLQMFDGIKNAIAQFEGCQSLSLLQSIESPNVVFTLSRWDKPESLERYRNSDLFKNVWRTTKAWFDKPAEAWSCDELVTL